MATGCRPTSSKGARVPAIAASTARRRSVLRGLGVALSGLALRPFSAAARGLDPELVEIPVNPEGRLDSAFGLIGTTPGTAARAISGPLAKRLAAMTPSPGATLRIFHHNDMHNHLVVRDSQKGETHPLSQIVKRVRRARAKAAADEVVLLLTAGDDRTGTEFDKLLGDVTGAGFAVDPSYVAYSAAAGGGSHRQPRIRPRRADPAGGNARRGAFSIAGRQSFR